VSLVVERQDGVLVDVVGGDDGESGKPLDVEGRRNADKGLPGDLGQVGQVAGVDADAKGAVALVSML